MKINSLSYNERLKLWKKWHIKFAYFPKRVSDHSLVWWENVYAKLYVNPFGTGSWAYRRISDGEPPEEFYERPNPPSSFPLPKKK